MSLNAPTSPDHAHCTKCNRKRTWTRAPELDRETKATRREAWTCDKCGTPRWYMKIKTPEEIAAWVEPETEEEPADLPDLRPGFARQDHTHAQR